MNICAELKFIQRSRSHKTFSSLASNWDKTRKDKKLKWIYFAANYRKLFQVAFLFHVTGAASRNFPAVNLHRFIGVTLNFHGLPMAATATMSSWRHLRPPSSPLNHTEKSAWASKRPLEFGCPDCWMLHRTTYNVCGCTRALVHNGQHPAWACSALMWLVNWVKMWKVNYVRISCYATNGWKIPPSLTSSSPHPETPKTSHDFQLVRLKVNRFNISDLCHLSIWLGVAAAWAPVVIYSEVVIQPSGSCIYVFYPPDPLNAPHSNKCGRLLKDNLVPLKKKVSALEQFSLHRKAFFFLAVRFRFFSGVRVTPEKQ